MMVEQSARIAHFCGNSTPLPSAGGSQQTNQIEVQSFCRQILQHLISHHWQNATTPPDCLLMEQVYNDRADIQSRM